MMEPLTTVLSPVTKELLKVAHYDYDLYFDGFKHNHLVHGIVSLVAIIMNSNSNNNSTTNTTTATSSSSAAGDDEEIQAHYNEQVKMYEPRRAPISDSVVVGTTITAANWFEHLDAHGNHQALSGNFLNFFDEQLSLFNINNDNNNNSTTLFLKDMLETYALMDARMLSRLVGGAVHPLIHLGYACELWSSSSDDEQQPDETARLILVEALAMQCTTRDAFAPVFESLEPLEKIIVSNSMDTSDENNNSSNRVLDILKLMQSDEALADVPTKDNPNKVDYTISRTDVMAKYYNMLFPPIASAETTTADDSSSVVQTVFEDLYIAAVAICFGSISTDTKKEPRLDFFLAHILTSAVALRQVLPYVSAANGIALCRAHFVATLVWYRARGHPTLDLQNLAKQPVTRTWEECETKIRENPSMEVHVLKVFRALQLGKSEASWTRKALQRGGLLLLPGGGAAAASTSDDDDDIWLICANILVQNVERNAQWPWLYQDAWDYYNS